MVDSQFNYFLPSYLNRRGYRSVQTNQLIVPILVDVSAARRTRAIAVQQC